jgi:hypothetical protein
MVEEPESSPPLIPQPFNGHDPEPVPSMSDPDNLSSQNPPPPKKYFNWLSLN